MTNILNLFRLEAVGFIDWLGCTVTFLLLLSPDLK
jgi:hypothetical protein